MPETLREFTPLPLRARSVLELLDTSLKVYKQYFWVLTAWSALINIIGAATSCGGGCVTFLLTPLLLGVAACCVSAAVRGQSVEFKQCWQFAQARFGTMLSWFIAAMCIVLLIFGAACAIYAFAVAFMGTGFSASATGLQAGFAIGFTIVFGIVLSVFSVALFTWGHIPSLVACMEENNPDKNVLRRSWDLMQGQWWRATSLMSLLSLAALALFLMLLAAGALFMGIDEARQAFTGQNDLSKMWVALIGIAFGSTMLMTLFTPAMMLALVLFYLDLRVRKDALDLEWTTHVTAPPAAVSTAPPASTATPLGFSHLSPETPQNVYPPPTAYPPMESREPPPPSVAPAPSWQTMITEPAPAPQAPPPPPDATGEIACPRCGASAPANYLFCMQCGTRLTP